MLSSGCVEAFSNAAYVVGQNDMLAVFFWAWKDRYGDTLSEIQLPMTKFRKALWTQDVFKRETFAGMDKPLQITVAYTPGEYGNLTNASPFSDDPELSFTSICTSNYSNLLGGCALGGWVLNLECLIKVTKINISLWEGR